MNKEQPRDKPSTKHETPKTTTDPIEVDVHGLKAKFFLNRQLQDIIPKKYLAKAEQPHIVQRTPWVFRRKERNAYRVDLTLWSELDIRYRGVFWTMKKIRRFDHRGLYESHSDHGSGSANARNTEGNAKTQSHVVYALLTELVDGLRIKRQVGNGSEKWIELRPRLFNCCMEYWTGYRAKFKDGPVTAGFLSLHFSPGARADHTVLPISTTEHDTCLEDGLEGKFKLILGQFLQNIARLKPPGDKLPDQEVFLIGLHGSRLHILRAIFPGSKTSRLWSGRYTGSSSSSDFRNNIEEMVNHSSNDDAANIFHILGSTEYNLWLESDFHEAIKALVGLIMYLMSGKAHCGPLEAAFNNLPPATNREERQFHRNHKEGSYAQTEETGNHEDQVDTDVFQEQAEERLALTRVEANDLKKESKREIKRRKKEEKLLRIRNMGHSSAGHRIASFGGFRKAWWRWVWRGRD